MCWDIGNAAKFGRREVPQHKCSTRRSARLRPPPAARSDFRVVAIHPQLSDLVDLLRAFPDAHVILNHVGGLLGIPPHDGTALTSSRHGADKSASSPRFPISP